MNRNPHRPRGGRLVRRAAGRRRRSRRAGSWLGWIAVPLTLLLLWLLLTRFVFVIRRVEVVGLNEMTQQEVARLSGIRLGDKMASVDEHIVMKNLESDGRLAYNGMRRRYPSTIRLNVRERSQDAMIVQAGKVLVLDKDGYVVSMSDNLPEKSMPYITGLKPTEYKLGRRLDDSDGRLSAMKTVLDAVEARDAGEYVSEISVELVKDLRVTTRKGIVVLLGDESNMNDKITWMVGAVKDLEARGETIGRLDVSSGNKADYLSMTTPTPKPTLEPTPTPVATPTPDAMAVLTGQMVAAP